MGSRTNWRWLRSPYLWITVGALLWIGVLDTHSWWQQQRLSRRLRQMQAQLLFYEKEIIALKAEEMALRFDTYTQEYHARRHYWVKRPHERLFLIQRHPSSNPLRREKEE
ncbi:MAG: hypothetical protein RMK19_08885 [Bacteroidia bacterium]|nr:hypothetical protein [Bacteroidia bacterium]MDW8016107.1 hypothetical protein [Bacteroidia bacterium]